MASTSTGG